MKKILSVFITFLLGFCFIASVNAEEVDLSSIASVTSTVGGSDKEIIQTDSSNTYKFYYKYMAIDSTDFNTYTNAKYIVDNSSDTSDEYVTASTQVEEYESIFRGLIPEVTAAELENWSLATDGEISLSDLTFESGKHNGYVLAVAAVKDGDTSKVYIDRLILESTSATTLGTIAYTTSNDTTITDSTYEDTTVTTNANPNTGISDYAIYLVPFCIIIGSAILLRKNYS